MSRIVQTHWLSVDGIAVSVGLLPVGQDSTLVDEGSTLGKGGLLEPTFRALLFAYDSACFARCCAKRQIVFCEFIFWSMDFAQWKQLCADL